MNLGIVGGGQLARMLALAAYPLNIKCSFLDPNKDACAAQLGDFIHAAYDDESALSQLANKTDVITFEFENVPAKALESLAKSHTVFPSPNALLVTQDRLTEKNLFTEIGIETAPFANINSIEDLRKATKNIGIPGILKTRRLGYDGKGQYILRDASDLETAWQTIGKVPATYEGFVPFDREISIITLRNKKGETRFYPLVENIHRNGILHLSTVQLNDPMQQPAEEIAKTLMTKLDYVGILVIELFQVGEKLLANEFAPRVHNTGHWTIEGAFTSQFENHLRAVAGLPLGSTDTAHPCAMINIVGDLPDCEAILEIPGAHLHLYDKQAREGRKIGHVTVCAKNQNDLTIQIERINTLIASQ